MDKINHIKNFLIQNNWINNITNVSFTAAGEYNENYKIVTTGNEYLFRMNHGTQLNIENQVEYEFTVLEALKNSSVTPKPYFYSATPFLDSKGVLLMEFLNGVPLNYKTDIDKAAYIFSKVHSQNLSGKLIKQINPVKNIADESYELINRYNPVDKKKSRLLLLNYYEKIIKLFEETKNYFNNEKLCIVNTEVNSNNFIINDRASFLVDWEKAVVSYRYQDLGHFIAPTTTLWKTNYNFTIEEKKLFIKKYIEYSNLTMDFDEVFEKTLLLENTILLRAISWCYMAYYEYINKSRNIINQDTFNKIKFYLNEAECFLK